jgi:cytochrome c553
VRSRRPWPLSILLCLPLAAAAAELPGVDDAGRARTNYMLSCQGCHGPAGEGNALADVPRMRGFVGNFLTVEGGRAFMVQVPGSANSPLSDAALAELLNWMLTTMSGDELPAEFRPFTEGEVSHLRQTPEADVVGRRAALIDAMGQRRIDAR